MARITRDKQIWHGDEQGKCTEVRQRTNKAEYSNTRRMCPLLAALDLILKLQEVGQPNNIQMEVMDQLRGVDVDLKQLASWASRMLMENGVERGRDRRDLDGLDPELLSYIGLSKNTFSKAQKANREEPLVHFYVFVLFLISLLAVSKYALVFWKGGARE